jgi:hypothetical protein
VPPQPEETEDGEQQQQPTHDVSRCHRECIDSNGRALELSALRRLLCGLRPETCGPMATLALSATARAYEVSAKAARESATKVWLDDRKGIQFLQVCARNDQGAGRQEERATCPGAPSSRREPMGERTHDDDAPLLSLFSRARQSRHRDVFVMRR